MTRCDSSARIHLVLAGIAHLVERHLAKVEVASSSLVARSRKDLIQMDEVFLHSVFVSNSLPNTVAPLRFAAFAKSSETTALPHSTGGRFSYSMILRTISSAGLMRGRLVRFASASLK